ncbi:hypothetical protein B0J17DRAFT_685795 [Rhizoctonia solani]|nr:hypothetical protein B0J17DRAFT_685795 [Rhizoctonia solani]
MYLRGQVDSKDPNAPSTVICDFIEDYRSGSILDVIGSIGGLFVLLQTLHVVLFGRPLLWGLTGAKLITPFGLLGKLSSRGFKRRLREEYHTIAEDGTELIQIVKFLRDFVMDFGPADLNPHHQVSHASGVCSPTAEVKDDEANPDISLLRMQSNASTTSPRASNADEDSDHTSDHNHQTA